MEVFVVKQFFLFAPACQCFLHVLAILHVKNPREVREAFRKPLIVIASPSDTVAPPLMGAFVGSEKIGELNAVGKANLVALSRV